MSDTREILIDQARIDAPDFPRSQEWWSGFVPCWTTASVRADGMVSLTYNGRHPFGELPELTAAQARRGFGTMDRWLRKLERVAVAIADGDGEQRAQAGLITDELDDARFGPADAEPEWATPGYDPSRVA